MEKLFIQPLFDIDVTNQKAAELLDCSKPHMIRVLEFRKVEF